MATNRGPMSPCEKCLKSASVKKKPLDQQTAWPKVTLYADGSVAVIDFKCPHRKGKERYRLQEQGLPAAFPRERIALERVTHGLIEDEHPHLKSVRGVTVKAPKKAAKGGRNG